MINKKYLTIFSLFLVFSGIGLAQADSRDVFYPEKDILNTEYNIGTAGTGTDFRLNFIEVKDTRKEITGSKVWIGDNSIDTTITAFITNNNSFDLNNVQNSVNNVNTVSKDINSSHNGWININTVNKEFSDGDMIVYGFKSNEVFVTDNIYSYSGNIDKKGLVFDSTWLNSTDGYYNNSLSTNGGSADIIGFEYNVKESNSFIDIIIYLIGGIAVISLLSMLRGVKRE